MKIVLTEEEIQKAIQMYLSSTEDIIVETEDISLKSEEIYYHGIVEFSAEIKFKN
jgi:hypothetical protein